MDTRKVPLTIMLLGALVACVVTYIYEYELSEMLVVLFISLVVFLIIGLIVQAIWNKFIPLPEEGPNLDEGEVIEKESEEGSEEESDTVEEDEDMGVVEKQ